MVASLVALLLMASPGAAGDVEVQRAIGPFEVSADATGESFRPVVLGAAAGDTAWRRARATFRFDAAPEGGHWLLCLGGPGLELDAELNGHALTRIVDAWQDRPELRAGPRVDVDAADLATTGWPSRSRASGRDAASRRGRRCCSRRRRRACCARRRSHAT
jgi:hypothetical protein